MGLLGGFKAVLSVGLNNNSNKTNKSNGSNKNEIVCKSFVSFSEFADDVPRSDVENVARNDVRPKRVLPKIELPGSSKSPTNFEKIKYNKEEKSTGDEKKKKELSPEELKAKQERKQLRREKKLREKAEKEVGSTISETDKLKKKKELSPEELKAKEERKQLRKAKKLKELTDEELKAKQARKEARKQKKLTEKTTKSTETVSNIPKNKETQQKKTKSVKFDTKPIEIDGESIILADSSINIIEHPPDYTQINNNNFNYENNNTNNDDGDFKIHIVNHSNHSFYSNVEDDQVSVEEDVEPVPSYKNYTSQAASIFFGEDDDEEEEVKGVVFDKNLQDENDESDASA